MYKTTKIHREMFNYVFICKLKYLYSYQISKNFYFLIIYSIFLYIFYYLIFFLFLYSYQMAQSAIACEKARRDTIMQWCKYSTFRTHQWKRQKSFPTVIHHPISIDLLQPIPKTLDIIKLCVHLNQKFCWFFTCPNIKPITVKDAHNNVAIIKNLKR